VIPLLRGLWRRARWVLLIASAGVVLAASDDDWTSFRIAGADPGRWFSSFYEADTPTADIALASSPGSSTRPGLSMTGMLNGLLFSRPSTTWRLDPSATEASRSWTAEESRPGIVSQANGDFAPGFFSSGVVSYSASGNGGPATTPILPNAPDASSNWISNASGNWGTAANWQGGVVASGAGSSAHFDQLDITTDVTVTNETPRTIGNLYVGDTDGTHHYTISGSTLTFDTGSDNSSALNQVATSAGDTISAPIIINVGLNVWNASTNVLTLSGGIAGGGQFASLHLSGDINVTGNITNGVSPGLYVQVDNGTATFSGTNSYTATTAVYGTLLVNGTNSGTGSIQVLDGGTLGGTGTIAGNVYIYDATVTGGTASTVGKLTLSGDLYLATGEGAGTYLANLSGSMSDLLAITGTLFLDGTSSLNIVGGADGHTTYTLATFGSLDGMFDPMQVMGIPSGYSLLYNPTDIELVPTAIPEPATWIGGAAAAAAALALRMRRRTAKS
jgi:hypothetical protein